MSYPETKQEKEALDRHITGNYGEDQFKDEVVTKKFKSHYLKWRPRKCVWICLHCDMEFDSTETAKSFRCEL
jgi:hypothetical protein